MQMEDQGTEGEVGWGHGYQHMGTGTAGIGWCWDYLQIFLLSRIFFKACLEGDGKETRIGRGL